MFYRVRGAEDILSRPSLVQWLSNILNYVNIEQIEQYQ